MRGRLDMTCRCLQPEIMDDPGLEEQWHNDALRGLARINLVSGSTRILWGPIVALAREMPSRPLRVLDIATGGGDVPIRLALRARRAGLPIQVEGCDRSPVAIHHAQISASRHDVAVRFFELDALSGAIPPGQDIVCCSLFLHHLAEDQAVCLLRHMAEATRRLVLVNDLARSRTGLLLAYAGTRLLSRSKVVHVDGPRSVRAAFTPEEALALAQQAGLSGATVERRWPCRYLLKWATEWPNAWSKP
jgi:2-polyprenyl-3-methyl-5-hydroxy-6-metoxy-1,4-benzoquinol methylase